MEPRYRSNPQSFGQPLPIVSMVPTQPVYQRALNNPHQAVPNPMLATLAWLASPVAMGVAWSRNSDKGVPARLGLSLLAGFLSYPYLAYVGYDMYVKPKMGK